jgi:hypothetical protein
MAHIAFQYRFTLADGTREVFDIELDARTMASTKPLPKRLPSWTKLNFRKCSHCPLSARTHPHCPLAARLVPVVHRFDGMLSHDEAYMEVTTKERTISAHTDIQRGIGSLIGLIIATSGCPHTSFLRPMARFHLPFASRDETVYRAVSMYLLAQYFRTSKGSDPDLTLTGLKELYRHLQTVNAAIVKRLHSITETDSMSNAIVVLDIFAKTMDIMIERSLQNIKPLFDAFLEPARE